MKCKLSVLKKYGELCVSLEKSKRKMYEMKTAKREQQKDKKNELKMEAQKDFIEWLFDC